MGRPPEPIPQDIASTLCRELASGKSLRSVCCDIGMPHEATVRGWALDDEEFGTQYARARALGREANADEIQDIADAKPADLIEASWQKTRIDARKWLASKQLPKRYGDKLDIEHSGHVELADAMRKARERLDAGS